VSQVNHWLAACKRIAAAFVGSACLATGMPAFASDPPDTAPENSATTAGLSVPQLARLPHVIFAHELEDVPGRNLVVVALDFPPVAATAAPAPLCTGHRHPGSVYVYVTKGSVRLGVAGQPVQVVKAGQSFYEEAGALHTVAENASATEPAAAIAVLVLPRGAPILTPEKCAQP